MCELVALSPKGGHLASAKLNGAGRMMRAGDFDGDMLSKDGKAYSLATARDALLAELAEGTKKFPFRIEGQVFHQVVEQGPGRYVIALVDSGWLNPAERETTIVAQLPGNWQATDRLTGAKLVNLNQPLTLRVPAGVFRLIELSATGD